MNPLARFLVRQRRRSAALAVGAMGDPVALSRLEMHRLATRAFDRDPGAARAFPVERIRSLTAAGRVGEALEFAKSVAPRPERDLALALAAFDPAKALTKYAGPDASLRAALKAAAGRHDDARAAAAASDSPQARFLLASLDRHDPARAADHWRAGFAAWGLTPPEALDPARPVSIVNARAVAAAVPGGPLISVIMPSRNAERWVAAAVRSVLDQSWRDLELLFVDDASTDDTAERAVKAAGGDPRFILIRRPERGGAYGARNAALEQARGHWVAIQDSDEWAHPDRLARQAAEMKKGGLVAHSGRSLRVDADGEIHARGVWPLTRWAPSTLMFERELVMAQAGFFHQVLSGADTEYWWRLAQLFGPRRVAISRTPLILGAWRADSLTGARDSGFGAGGFNLDRLIYWERWTAWHARNLRTPERLRLEPGDQPFRSPKGIVL